VDDLTALEKESYWGPSSSQAEVMREQARQPSICGEPVVWVERLGPDLIEYRFENLPHDDSIRIVYEILPKALELYLKKTKDYGGLSGGLGPKAPFVDMWRKIIKLKRCLWDGEKLKFEQTDEIIMDLIGTCLNILAEMKAEGDHAVRESSPS